MNLFPYSSRRRYTGASEEASVYVDAAARMVVERLLAPAGAWAQRPPTEDA